MSRASAGSAAATAMARRYDRRAGRYARHWAPVLAPAASALLDHVAARIPGDGAGLRLLDVGTGTGTLAGAALERWPRLEVVALDSSAGMLAAARRSASRRGSPDHLARLSWHHGQAATTGLADASLDVVVSSFVLQLVPDRGAALRELWRVLRPGGALGYVTWRDDRTPFEPAEAFDEAVVETRVAEPDEEPCGRAGDLASPAAAAAQLRRAGFRAVGAIAGELRHRWTPAGYLAFKLRYEEADLVEGLTAVERRRLEEAARRRLQALPREAFEWRTPIVYAWGRRPA